MQQYADFYKPDFDSLKVNDLVEVATVARIENNECVAAVSF